MTTTKPETAEAFAKTLDSEAAAFELDTVLAAALITARDELIASAAFDAGRAGVDELMERIASLEAQLATAREGALMQVFRIITKNWDPQTSMAHRVYQAVADLILEARDAKLPAPPSQPAAGTEETP